MVQFFDSSDFHNHHPFYTPESRASSEWSGSPIAGTPMIRDPSTESAITTYSDEIIQSPNLEYESYNSPWLPMPMSDHDSPWSPTSDSNHDMGFPSTSYNATESWWEFYDFIVDVEPGQQPYWRLKPIFQPTDQFPVTRVPEESPRPQTIDGMFFCMFPECPKSFGRKADLERHYKQIHTSAEEKEKFPCDWKKCDRLKEPFGRRDHQRDHYRVYHKEDLMRRGSSNKEDEKWWNERKVIPDWWRCARCLGRVKVEEDGWVCPACRTICEQQRQDFRSR
ncbi:hypothetical protein F5Y09DRAFT_163734 [Xylaria sp. FL1042]|nr:hypothetical protein F5Y09DRAFT_163734 [Xylaria sp. FL1042]